MLEQVIESVGDGGSEELRGAAALRLRVRLQPAAGAGARVLPPTYAGPDGPIYLREQRRVEDVVVPCVLLDSHASQANRLEDALLAQIACGAVRVPDVVVDQSEFGRHSALEFPHRVFDAWVEDALDGEQRFGTTDLYASLASVINRGVAGPLVECFPVGLLLGCWASRQQNPQGSTRIGRAVTSEIIGYDALDGARAASRVDLHHVASGVGLRDSHSGQARFEVLEQGAKAKGGKRPSEYGYGNVTPSAATHGGVTIRCAEQQTVVSLAALRAVRTTELGAEAPSDARRDVAARQLLVLLALAMLEAQVDLGWELRSGCQLVPESEPTLELVDRLGRVAASAPLLALGAVSALAKRTEGAAQHGIRWEVSHIELAASPEQLELLRRSMGLAAEEPDED